jgi:cell wall-associated NlpC family hydrolase
VEKEDLQPGDLVYFGKAPEKKITHTGMYIGGGEFIHATAHEKPVVQISRLDDPHWTEVYAAARRLQ